MGVHKGFFALFLLLAIWLAGKFLLPFLFPFVLGTLLAVAAEPVVRLGTSRLKLSRGLCAGLGVSATLLLLIALLFFVGSLAVKELGNLATAIPQTLHQSSVVLEDWLTQLSARAPAQLQPLLNRSVENIFADRQALANRAVGKVPGILSGVLGKVPGKAMSIGTGILSGFFISARLPKLKDRLPPVYYERILPVARHLRQTLGKWLVAQGKLIAITYGIVTAGLLLLRIPFAPAWALLVAAVDAVPLLGTGTVLVPWALVRFLQNDPLQGFGLLAIYVIAMVTRTVLEPRFYGKHLGVDPLVMLVFLYFGYRLWGFWGIVISPLLAAATKALTDPVDTT